MQTAAGKRTPVTDKIQKQVYLRVERANMKRLLVLSLLGLCIVQGFAQEKDLARKIKIQVNNLNSTTQYTAQSSAKTQLIKMGKQAVPYLAAYLLNDKRTYVRVQIAHVLGEIKEVSSISVLETAAQSKYIALNEAAVAAIGKIGGVKAIDSLKRIKGKTGDEKLKVYIDDALKTTKAD